MLPTQTQTETYQLFSNHWGPVQDYTGVLCLFFLNAVVAIAQTFHFKGCPEASVQEDFNVTDYMGNWFEIEKLPAMFERGKCIQASYSLLSDGTVKVHNQELLSNGKISSIEGVAKVKDPSQPAKLDVSFFKGVPDAPYWVLSTDYQSYALVYSCSDYFGVFHVDFAWILSRHRTLSEDVVDKLHGNLSSIGINLDLLTVSDQNGCKEPNQ